MCTHRTHMHVHSVSHPHSPSFLSSAHRQPGCGHRLTAEQGLGSKCSREPGKVGSLSPLRHRWFWMEYRGWLCIIKALQVSSDCYHVACIPSHTLASFSGVPVLGRVLKTGLISPFFSPGTRPWNLAGRRGEGDSMKGSMSEHTLFLFRTSGRHHTVTQAVLSLPCHYSEMNGFWWLA